MVAAKSRTWSIADALKKITTDGLDKLAASLDAGHSDQLWALPTKMARFHKTNDRQRPGAPKGCAAQRDRAVKLEKSTIIPGYWSTPDGRIVLRRDTVRGWRVYRPSKSSTYEWFSTSIRRAHTRVHCDDVHDARSHLSEQPGSPDRPPRQSPIRQIARRANQVICNHECATRSAYHADERCQISVTSR